jgi:hypothetical protein
MKKHRTKWASAEHKRLAQELDTEWQNRLREYVKMSKPVSRSSGKILKYSSPKIPPGRNTTKNIPSVASDHRGAVSSPPVQFYTGDKVLGIAVQHKSCLQPIFSAESAVDSAHMRR